VLPGIGLADAAAGAADDDGDLALVVQPLRFGRTRNLAQMADLRVRHAQEQHRLLGGALAHLLHVLAVVQPGTPDLPRRRNHRQPGHVSDGAVRRTRGDAARLVQCIGLEQRLQIGVPTFERDPQVDDAVVTHDAEGGATTADERSQLHESFPQISSNWI